MRGALLHVFAHLQLHVADHAGGGRRHRGARQIDLRRIVGGLRLGEARVPLRGQLRITDKARKHAVGALVDALQTAARGLQILARLVVDVGAAHATLFQHLLALQLPREELDPLLRARLPRPKSRDTRHATTARRCAPRPSAPAPSTRRSRTAWDRGGTAACRRRPAGCPAPAPPPRGRTPLR